MAILPETENYIFGSGSLFAVRTDIANATPTKFGVLQDVNVEMSGETKMLYGSQQFPVAVGRGKSKITAACKVGMFQMRPLSDLMWGTSYATGQQTMASGEAHSVPASSTYTVTVTNVTGFVDYGVYYASSTAQLTRVASVIAIGTYSVTTGGVYTFYSGDAGVATPWQEYFGLELDEDSDAFTVLLNAEGTRRLRSWRHKERCELCDSEATVELDLSEIADHPGS